MLRKATLAAAVIAFATAGSALFGGSALADEEDHDFNTAGRGGDSTAVADCDQIQHGLINVQDVAVSVGLLAAHFDQKADTGDVCAATSAGGKGGDAKKDDKKDDVKMGMPKR
jgi:hypothetical protein